MCLSRTLFQLMLPISLTIFKAEDYSYHITIELSHREKNHENGNESKNDSFG